MSLNRVNASDIVKKQFQYKLKAYVGIFTSLVVVQIIAIIFSYGGTGGGFSSINGIDVQYQTYTVDNVIVLTSLWALIHAIIMTTKKDWQHAFPFVGNSWTNNLSNILLLLFASIIAAVLTVLSAFALRVIIFYFVNEDLIRSYTFFLTAENILSGLYVLIFHFFFICAIGYFLGTVSRIHPMLPILVPVIMIGLLIVFEQIHQGGFWIEIATFYYEETNPVLFFVKMVTTSTLLFAVSVLISNRTEVRT